MCQLKSLTLTLNRFKFCLPVAMTLSTWSGMVPWKRGHTEATLKIMTMVNVLAEWGR